MKIAVRGGHNPKATGASALIDELTENRKVYKAVIKYLKTLGHEVLDVTPGPMDRNSDLAYGVNKAKEFGAELFISIHFNNAYIRYNGAIGSEVWLNVKNSISSTIATRITNNMEYLGFKNRGLKDGLSKGLYEIRRTPMAAIIVEVCFVEATGDVELYKKIGHDVIGKSIAEGIAGQSVHVDVKTKYTVQYCLEFQKWYNATTKTREPLVEDGIYGPKTEKALQTITNIIREF